MSPALSVVIPTYNRVDYLRRSLDWLLPQVADDVEVLVSDNASTDGTGSFLQSWESSNSAVRIHRQKRNVGLLRNVQGCFELASGDYIWLLCDDDIAAPGSVRSVLAAIAGFDRPRFLFVRSHWGELENMDMNQMKVDESAGAWEKLNGSEFLSREGQWVTVGSSIIIRRSFLRELNLQRWESSLLWPTALTLFAVGVANGCVISRQPHVYCQADNQGGYDGLSVFCGDLDRILADACQYGGFTKKSIRAVKKDVLRGRANSIVRSWPLTAKGVLALIRMGWSHKELYLYCGRTLLNRAVLGTGHHSR